MSSPEEGHFTVDLETTCAAWCCFATHLLMNLGDSGLPDEVLAHMNEIDKRFAPIIQAGLADIAKQMGELKGGGDE